MPICNYEILITQLEGFDDNLKDVTQNHRYNFFNPKSRVIVQFK